MALPPVPECDAQGMKPELPIREGKTFADENAAP